MVLSRDFIASVRQHASTGRFVFTGVVERTGASSLAILPAGPGSAVVRVERIHRGAQALQDQAGQPVTVLFDESSEPADGDRWVFFTDPILFGETVGVREVARLQAPEDLDDLHELVVRVWEEVSLDELRQHLASADAVIQGRVVSAHRASGAPEPPTSEHDPLWWIARIHVRRALKGRHRGDIAVRFPSSRDIAWYRVPKLRRGQEGIFVLHRDGVELDDAVLAILHPEDFQPGDTDEVREIAKLV
jgi:hypothetical protein